LEVGGDHAVDQVGADAAAGPDPGIAAIVGHTQRLAVRIDVGAVGEDIVDAGPEIQRHARESAVGQGVVAIDKGDELPGGGRDGGVLGFAYAEIAGIEDQLHACDRAGEVFQQGADFRIGRAVIDQYDLDAAAGLLRHERGETGRQVPAVIEDRHDHGNHGL